MASECPITAECAGRMIQQLDNLEKGFDEFKKESRENLIAVTDELKKADDQLILRIDKTNEAINKTNDAIAETNKILTSIQLTNAKNNGFMSGFMLGGKTGATIIIIAIIGGCATVWGVITKKIDFTSLLKLF